MSSGGAASSTTSTNPFDVPYSFEGGGMPPTSGQVSLISREVVDIYNLLVESGRWNTEYTTNPVEFRNTLIEIRKLLTGGDLESIPHPTKTDLKITNASFLPLTMMITSVIPASSRKTLKRSHKSSSRKQTYKHSKKQ